MSVTTSFEGERAPAQSSSVNLYRAVWRWHFYAGLFVLPFLISLAVTGALYLFRDEFDNLIHSDLKRIEVAQNVPKALPSDILAAAVAAVPGTAVKYTTPGDPGASTEITVSTAEGKRAVYVNTYTGQVAGSLPDRGTIMWTIRYIHSLKYFGTYTRYLIEIAAGWSILLVATGIYLWWPRKQSGGVLTVRGTPKKRVFWRDTHAVTGIFVGFFIVFLAVTGMPWSGVWGAKVNEWANGSNFGYPAGVRTDVPMSGEHLDHMAKTSWSLEQAKIPESSASATGQPIGIDAAIARFDGLGLAPGYTVVLPTKPTGVYSGSVYPDDLSKQRVVHLDQYSGKPLIDMSYSDYGPLGKVLEWGINVHMGQQFGLANQIVLLAACVGIVLLAVSAGIMWWKRRPRGSLGVPPLPQDKRVLRGLLALLAIGGILFPLVGASLLVMLVLDLIVQSREKQRAA
ncbi:MULTISPECIES: PepSY-associated TM helix domain-containing protein [Rhizobium/Agrobacterium group]|uniref:PepSY-associated TM helix domain-containing protein n=1 Tax=Rhizobium/Agrobacterium group TaxID=227290 RepID=UPI0003F1D34A|nr:MULTISPECIES: PepSY domain-containing protein [Rhizobium/Agrobacterium group]AHK01816.1 iron-uptake factor PiuB [Agrobacterium tumefaciens LBA4213 (Ach5)]AKC07658.1 sulfite reductase [Agrobacterium tumefaciens]AYM16498.1 sulfite reductase [Agrobacterium tumefaciens]AYM67799.1 sulfite reductase [Agrobacterium tumefaciens]NIB55385.1 PepSY domain-containing protein [Agrobacterium tumefaciens]